MEVPEKYLKECSNGAKELSIAESLIQDGYGKLRSVAVLRRLFELSLQEADQVYENAIEIILLEQKSKEECFETERRPYV